MRIEICDICGVALDQDKFNMFEKCPNGFFDLEFHRLVTDGGKPSGWHYDSFHMCPQCLAEVNQAIFEKIKQIQETQFHPTAVVRISKFLPEPVEIKNGFPSPVCGCGRADD